MDREANQEKPSLHSTTSTINNSTSKEDHKSPRKPPHVGVGGGGNGGGGGGGGGSSGNGDRLKRDEWSEGAVTCLLEAYEEKWILRNRAKLKGQDWEDVAKYVSGRASSAKSPKTQTQCKNKIESMKKRYRSETATAAADAASSWPLYSRLDHLLRGNSHPSPPPPPPPPPLPPNHPFVVLSHEPPPQQQQHPTAAPPPPPARAQGNAAQISHDSNGCDRVVKEDGAAAAAAAGGGGPNNIVSNQESGKDGVETDSSTPAIYSDNEKLKTKTIKMRSIEKRKHRRESCAIAESIRLLAEVVVRSEQARMDTMRELERMRAETEAKRGEMDLKRTEIIANTQLEIAKIFAGICSKGVDPSLRIGRN